MKKLIDTVLVLMVLLTPVWVLAGGAGNTPLAVSPGSDSGVATVSQSCPTFSWSAVQQAASYRIVVFQAPDAMNRSYEELAGMGAPVIGKDILGAALSWTPTAEERLQTGSLYAWYVQAVDGSGNSLGAWSSGRMFKVEQENAWAGAAGKMAEILKSYGLGDDVIAAVMKDLKSWITDSGVRSAAPKNPPQGMERTQGTEGASNTFYGLNAGAAITSGLLNTFIGVNAGKNTTSGSNNTYFGYGAGTSNTTGSASAFALSRGTTVSPEEDKSKK